MEATSGVERRIEFINTEMYALRRPLSPHVGGRVRHLRASYPHRPSTVCAPHLQKEDGIAPEGEGEGLRDFADKCAHGVSLVSMPACGCVAAAVALCAPLDSTGHKDAARSEQNQGRRLGLLLPLRSAGVQKQGEKANFDGTFARTSGPNPRDGLFRALGITWSNATGCTWRWRQASNHFSKSLPEREKGRELGFAFRFIPWRACKPPTVQCTPPQDLVLPESSPVTSAGPWHCNGGSLYALQ
jgi:hypothetical protein